VDGQLILLSRKLGLLTYIHVRTHARTYVLTLCQTF